MKLSDERITGRQGVNAAQAFFESNRCVFQEVSQQNDFGKDGYVDLGEAGVVTYLCAALQIKSGASYRTTKGDYFIPVDDHADNWRRSTVPVFGLVFDPADGLLRWVDLTGYLRDHPKQSTGSVPVFRDNVLGAVSLRREFKAALAKYAASGFGALTLNLLSAGPLQTDSVYDAWALGRCDVKYLLILRRLILDLKSSALVRAIVLLSHAGDHPDIFYTPNNWIPQPIQNAIVPSFRWSPEEIAHMLRAIDPADWGRGTRGQCLDVLFYEDPDIVAKLHISIRLLLKDPDTTQAVRAATLALTHSRDQHQELKRLIERHPALMEHEWFQELALAVQESPNLSLYQ
ncbi:MAG: DUF4365 domain-containing protein [Bacteroidota bacterium]